MTHAVVPASLDMGVATTDVRFCRYLDTNTVFDVDSQAIVEASMVADNIHTDAAKITRHVYPSVAATDSDVMMKSLTWS